MTETVERPNRQGTATLPVWFNGSSTRSFRMLLAETRPVESSFLVPRMSLGGLDALRSVIPNPKRLRILLSAPLALTSINETAKPLYSLLSTTPAELVLKSQLTQFATAKSLHAWLKRSAIEIRLVQSTTSLPGMVLLNGCAAVGNPEITRECLDAQHAMSEAGLMTLDADATQGLGAVYERWWAQGIDVKAEVLAALNLYWQENAPQWIYFLSLWHLFGHELETYRSALADDRRLEETPIWKALFAFQRHGAMAALRKLKETGGCILADSVGLGKTYTALAVAKAYERMGKRVLVVCPKRLRANWMSFLSMAEENPFKNECGDPDFRYYLLSHTDFLSGRKVDYGRGERIPVEDFLKLESGLIILDESHNFKNHSSRRYDFLLQHLRQHPQTHLLLLSATPVNNRLAELTHQLALIHRIPMKEKSDDEATATFNQEVANTLRQSQRVVNAWNKRHANDDLEQLTANTLVDELPGRYFSLLERYTIARNRKSIVRFYATAEQEIGAFPKRKVYSHSPAIDTEGKQEDITALSNLLAELSLAAYNPLSCLKVGEVVKIKHNLDDRLRQGALVALMRMNALKRLESSVASFRSTVESTFLKRIKDQLAALDSNQILVPAVTAEALEEEDAEVTEDYAKHLLVGTERFDVERLREKILADKEIIEKILADAGEIDLARDAKLAHLNHLLQEKLAKPLNAGNTKALIFTAFADTAEYIAKALQTLNPECTIAFVTGSNGVVYHKGEKQHVKMGEILARFAPLAQRAKGEREPIDWLIATDCLSEGQNLQDCDLLINYDVHWNPLRLNQRAGRIDRIGSPNAQIAVHNFWPMKQLDRYIGLEQRIRTKDAMASIAGAGTSNLDDNQKITLKYRDQQLKEMIQGNFDSELNPTFSSRRNDFSEYLAELDGWLAQDEQRLEQCLTAPYGLYAVTPSVLTETFKNLSIPLPNRGVIFLLKRNGLSAEENSENPFGEHFLLAVDDKGERIGMEAVLAPAETLALFRGLARDRAEVNVSYSEAFHAAGDKALSRAVTGALNALKVECETNRARLLLGDTPFDFHSGQTDDQAALTLISFLVFGDFSEVKHG